ncbi:MAG TPA: peptidoglycan DD-metalloendopeptidase family protein [Acidimicrobiales bacterium]|nr:peptidoglycan DD-metalloendopeptidase family protein [Acidimicrobiales bacterium]
MIRALGGLVLALVLALGGVSPVAAQDAPSPDERKEQVAAEVERLREQLDEAAAEEADVLAELEVTRRIRSELDATVADLEGRAAAAAAELATAEEDFATAVRGHRRAQADLDRARAQLDDARRTLESQAVSSFMRYGVDMGTVDVLLQVRDLRQLHDVAGLMAAVAASQAQVIERYQELDQSTQELEARAERARTEASERRDAIAEQHRVVAAARAKQAQARAEAVREEAREREVLAGAQDARADYEERLSELRAESDAIAELLRARQAAATSATTSTTAPESVARATATGQEQRDAAPAAPTDTPKRPAAAPPSPAATRDPEPAPPPKADPAPAPPPATSPPHTHPPVTPAGSSTLGWPLASPVVTSGFGYRIHPIFGTSRLHAGIDLRGSTGTPILAAGEGVVVSAGWRGGYGNTVIIDHGGSLATLYAHQSQIHVRAGATVRRGQAIGAVGSTGQSTGPHLHFEVRVNGTPVDPLNYL